MANATGDLLPPDTDVDELLERGFPADWRRIWETYNHHTLWTEVARTAATDDARRAAAAATDEITPVTPLQALRANEQLVKHLTGVRWQTMRDARAHGATWDDIGGAVGQTRQGVHGWYRRAIELQEHHLPDLHDTDRARAALADPD